MAGVVGDVTVGGAVFRQISSADNQLTCIRAADIVGADLEDDRSVLVGGDVPLVVHRGDFFVQRNPVDVFGRLIFIKRRWSSFQIKFVGEVSGFSGLQEQGLHIRDGGVERIGVQHDFVKRQAAFLQNVFHAAVALLVDDKHCFCLLTDWVGLRKEQQGAGILAVHHQMGGIVSRQMAVAGVHQGELGFRQIDIAIDEILAVGIEIGVALPAFKLNITVAGVVGALRSPSAQQFFGQGAVGSGQLIRVAGSQAQESEG